ncbi:MAG: menaquinone biosynthetic enzyme MqnA/MqnD family protein [Longimicrobiales bacterium]
MMRLGDIEYSNCFPVHAQLIEEGPPPGVELVRGTPGELNAALAQGRIDVAPCSSIEYARHADEYRLMPALAIASDGAVGSILLESSEEPAALDGRIVAVPTASATSVVLLRGLLEEHWNVRPRYVWYDQREVADPMAGDAAAVLRIGDVALNRSVPGGRQVLDLGAAWKRWTGLPFVYALWQARWTTDRAAEFDRLHDALLASLTWFRTNVRRLAETHAHRYGIQADRLQTYWNSLGYVLDERMEQGLLDFYSMAVRLGEAPVVPVLHWTAAARAAP